MTLLLLKVFCVEIPAGGTKRALPSCSLLGRNGSAWEAMDLHWLEQRIDGKAFALDCGGNRASIEKELSCLLSIL